MTAMLPPRRVHERAPRHDVVDLRSARGSRDGRCRVVQVTPYLSIGGLERMIVTLARALDPAEFDVHVVCLGPRDLLASDLEQSGIPVYALGEHGGGADYLAAFRMRRLLRTLRPDVVQTHNTQALVEGGVGAVLAGAPVLIHTDHARRYPDKLRYLVAEHLVARAAYRVVGVSGRTTDELARHVRIPRRKLVTIPNGIDGSPMAVPFDHAARRRELGIPADAPIIGSVARLAPQKGLGFLLDAMPAVLARHPRAVLLLVGEGESRAELEAQAAALGVGDRVRFTGMRRDTADLVRLMDIFALSSVWEGLPLTILEAMAAGRPVVATDVGGVATAVTHGVTGLVVDPMRAELLAAALGELLADPARCREYGDAGAREFTARFSAAAMAEAYGALYRRALHERGARPEAARVARSRPAGALAADACIISAREA